MKKLAILFLGLAYALPLAASAEAYKCTTTQSGKGGWVPPELILAYDTKAEVGSAYDPYIHHVHKTPIPVEWSRRSETSFVFRWTIKGVKSTNVGSGINSYKVVLFTDRNAFILSGRRHGYSNVINGSGTCQRIK